MVIEMQISILKNCNIYSTIFISPSRFKSPCLQEGISNFNDKWAGRLIRKGILMYKGIAGYLQRRAIARLCITDFSQESTV
jgi:hypothetical protein